MGANVKKFRVQGSAFREENSTLNSEL